MANFSTAPERIGRIPLEVMDHMREAAMQKGTAVAGVMTDSARDAIETQNATGAT